MADPLSITTGVFTLVLSALQAAQQTKAFIEGIRGAPRAVNALLSDLAALSNVLGTLENFLKNENQSRSPNKARIVVVLQSPLNNCMKSLNDIKREIEPFVKPLSGTNTSKWKAFIWTFREKDIIALQRALVSSQSLLDSAVAVVSLSSSTNEFTTIRRTVTRGFGYDQESVGDSGFAGSEVAGTDYGYAMRRFILDDDTVIEESPPLSPVLEEDKDPFGVHISQVPPSAEDAEPDNERRQPPQRPQTGTRMPLPPQPPAPGPETLPQTPHPGVPHPGVPSPTIGDRNTLLRKIIVRPAAPRQKKMTFEERARYVHEEMEAVRARSLEICKDPQKWGALKPIVETPPSRQRPPREGVRQATEGAGRNHSEETHR